MALTSTERSRRRRALMTAGERTAERTKHAVQRRIALVRVLAPDGICSGCLRKFPFSELVIDHINGRLWLVEELSPSMRAARYWREHNADVPLRAICNPCSGVMGGGIRYHGTRPVSRRAAERVAPRGPAT